MVVKSNSIFEKLKKLAVITEKEKHHCNLSPKKAANVGKLYLLSWIHKRLSNLAARFVISNYGTPTKKVKKFLDHRLQPVMKEGKSYIKDTKEGKSYIKDTTDFLDKRKGLGETTEGAILVPADVVGLAFPTLRA